VADAPVLVPCLVKLRAEFNALAPSRAKDSDGWIGDTAHQERQSDHNDDEVGKVPIRDADTTHEVHAVDVDTDLRTPGLSMETVVQHIARRLQSGAENRLRYIIYNRRIWHVDNGYRLQPYTGDDPHIGHAHFSASYDSLREASTHTWTLGDLMTVPTADQNATAVVTKDIDPGPNTYQLGGGVWTILARSGILNGLPGQIQALKDDLDARVQDVDDELDGLNASLVLLISLISQITNEPGVDPNIWYDVMKKAAQDALDA
jgi:hypothetical protein